MRSLLSLVATIALIFSISVPCKARGPEAGGPKYEIASLGKALGFDQSPPSARRLPDPNTQASRWVNCGFGVSCLSPEEYCCNNGRSAWCGTPQNGC